VVPAALAVASCGGSTGGDSVTGVSIDEAAEAAVLSSAPLEAIVEEADGYGEGDILPSDLDWDPMLDADFSPNPDGTMTESCRKRKVTICHKGRRTIKVSRRALKKHLRHGDTKGECPAPGASCPCFSLGDIEDAAGACNTSLTTACDTGDPYTLLLSCDTGPTFPPDRSFYISNSGGASCSRTDVFGTVSQDGLSQAEYQACVDVINSSGYCS
jgi:hypothetical protein